MTDDVWTEEAARHDDDDTAAMFAPELLQRTVRFLQNEAAGGRVLEFAVGTGRVALALAARGVPVDGVELSQPMVDRLRAKPGGTNISVTVGNMTTTQLPDRYSLIYLVFNTISNLLIQEEQVACFRNASAHLVPGGSSSSSAHLTSAG
nr:class I SAM-dependent methyltransferase [Nakamurella deserti]